MVSKLSEHIPPSSRVLILYGGSSAERNGTLNDVRSALGNRFFREFGGIESNPTYETLIKAIFLVRNDNLDFILAVGGGSVMDGAKFIAAAVLYEGEPWDIPASGGKIVKQALPLGTVVTLSASGSEMNCMSVISRLSTGEKLMFCTPLIFPVFSVLDPTLTLNLPEKQVANGIVDSFVHVMEQYMTYPVNAMVQDRFSEGLLSSLIEIGPRIIADPENYELRSNLMWIATLALNGLIGAGVPHDWASHIIGHEITVKYKIDHARTLSILYPSMLKVRRKFKYKKLLQYAERVWNLTEGDEESRIDIAIQKTEDFFQSLGAPIRLSDCDINAQDIDTLLQLLTEHGMNHLGEHGDITFDSIREILTVAS